jgi:RimJ/RimL family protein N-acetyltransferase
MATVIETNRLILREFELSDAPYFYELNADWDVMKYTGDIAFQNIEESEDLIRNYSDYKRNSFGRNTVILKESGAIIGWCGLKKREDSFTDIGYRFFKKYWNKGYATESARAIIEFGFNNYGLTEIIGNASAENIGSIRVFEKLGMTFLKNTPCEGIENSVRYQILKNNWSF